jgi:hypothetical protein
VHEAAGTLREKPFAHAERTGTLAVPSDWPHLRNRWAGEELRLAQATLLHVGQSARGVLVSSFGFGVQRPSLSILLLQET